MERESLQFRFRIEARFSALSTLRGRFARFLETAGFDCGEAGPGELLLALDEAASNIVRHGYGLGDPGPEEGEAPGVIDVEFSVEAGELEIMLMDDGIPRKSEDFRSLPPRTPGESGMGMEILRHVMDGLSCERSEQGRNLLRMRRRRGDSDWSGLDA